MHDSVHMYRTRTHRKGRDGVAGWQWGDGELAEPLRAGGTDLWRSAETSPQRE
jgi:hypothetical protein